MTNEEFYGRIAKISNEASEEISQINEKSFKKKREVYIQYATDRELKLGFSINIGDLIESDIGEFILVKKKIVQLASGLPKFKYEGELFTKSLAPRKYKTIESTTNPVRVVKKRG